MRIQISPSLLAADFARLGQEVEAVARGGADMLHLDVMDGVFVPNISFGMPVIASLRKATDLFFDVHIMITHPERYIRDLAAAGADLVTFHVEAAGDPVSVIEEIHRCGMKAGVTLRPDTPAAAVLPLLPRVELVLVMTVEPGFGGQAFRPEMMPKVEEIAVFAKGHGLGELIIQVDGGIGADTAALCAAHGANCFVAGSSIFGARDKAGAIAAIRTAAQDGRRSSALYAGAGQRSIYEQASDKPSGSVSAGADYGTAEGPGAVPGDRTAGGGKE